MTLESPGCLLRLAWTRDGSSGHMHRRLSLTYTRIVERVGDQLADWISGLSSSPSAPCVAVPERRGTRSESEFTERTENVYLQRMSMRTILSSLLLTSFAAAPQGDDLVRVRSARDFTQTVTVLDSVITAANLKIFGRVDHAANARGANLELRPTTVFIFGNPAVGTRLMQCEQKIAIDLPLRILVWEDSANTVWIGYESPARVAERHRVQGCREVIDRMTTAMSTLTSAAAGTARR